MEEQRWRGSSATERSAQRRDQLLEAGLELLGTGGGRALTVRSICREAGLSGKYFYESFTDREHFLGQLYDSVIAQLADSAASAATGHENPREVLRALFLAAIGFLKDDPRRARVVFTEPLVDDNLRERARRTFPEFVETLAPTVGISFDGPGAVQHSLPLAALGGGLLLSFITWLEGDTGQSEHEFADFCVDVVLSTPGVRLAAEGSASGRNRRVP